LLELPRAANGFDFSTIADVQLVIEYTGLDDDRYRERMVTRLNSETFGGALPLRVRFSYPDQMYHLLNPRPSGPETTDSLSMNLRTITIAAGLREFLPNERNRVLDSLMLAFYQADGAQLPIEQIHAASRRRVEGLWRSGATPLQAAALDPVADAGHTRLVRDGRLVRVATGTVPGEFASTGAWHRVLRGPRLVWVPIGSERPGDVLPAALNPAARPLPAVLPVELVEQARVATTVRSDTNAATGEVRRYFELTADAVGLPVPLAPEDTWYVTFEPTGSPQIPQTLIDGHAVLDLSALAEALIVVNYQYGLSYPLP
jgi:hypothetical protein